MTSHFSFELLERIWSDALSRLKLQAELEQTRRGPRQQSPRRPSAKIIKPTAITRRQKR